MAQQIAEAASAFEQLRTGHGPKFPSVTVVLSEDTLVVTLHGALSPAEKALAQTPAGAAQVQEFHRQLFTDSADPMRREIKRITGVDVRQKRQPKLRPRRVRSCMYSRLVRWCRCFCSPTAYLRTPGAAMEKSIKTRRRSTTMLVLSRKSNESVVVGGHGRLEPTLKVTVLEIKMEA